MTGTQLHTEARMNPETQAPVLAQAHWLLPPRVLESRSVSAHFSAAPPEGATWWLSAHACPGNTSNSTLDLNICLFQALCPRISTQRSGPASPQPMPTRLSARALLDTAATAPAFTHSTATFLPCHISGQDIVTRIWSRCVEVALSAPAAHGTLPGGAGSPRWGWGWRPGWKIGAGRCLGL